MQLVSERLVHAVESFFSDEIEKTNYKVKENLSRQDVVTHAEIASMDCLHTLLEFHVWRLCHKTFVYELHKYRESLSYPANPSSSKIFDRYVSLIDKELISNWFTKYDFLRKMVTQSVNNTCSFIEDVSHNFSRDATLLLSKGLISRGSKLQAITPLESDPHNGSKVNLCLEFKSSKKILYKPRSLEIDVLIDELFSDTLKFDTLQNYSPVPRTVNRGKYGWQEFVQHTPISQSETGSAYYNLGLCAAVFSCLGATDLHDENIIFNGIFPYVVDLETSLQPKYGRSHSLHESMEEMISHSIANTSIIPAKQLTLPHEVLIGAINTPYPQVTNEMVFTLKNPGTDAVDLAKEKITVERTTVPITLTDNQAPDPLPFQEDFLNGYSDGYEKMMDKREQIYSKLTDIECLMRVVIRPTVQYYFMLDACLFPENLVDDASINQVLKYLKPPRLIRDSEIAKKTLEEEIRSIKNGDIPHFSIKANDKRLYSMDFVSNEIFDVSPANNAIKMLEELSQKRLLHDKRLIAEGYSDIRIHEADHKKTDDLGYQSPLFSNVLRKVTKDNPDPLIELIRSLSITTKTDNAQTGWIGGVYGNIPISYDSTALISLHDTGGILFLLEHMTEYEKTVTSPENINLFNQANKGLKSLRHAFSSQLESAPISIVSGYSSLDFIFNHNSNRVKGIEEIAMHFQSEETPRGDIFIGPTGIGLTLASFSDTPNQILRELESKICIENPSTMLSSDGLAHGNLGVIWAQFRLSFALKDIEGCKRFFKKASQISFPNTVNTAGWCNGNAGLLMVLAEMASALNEQLDLYEVAKKSTALPKDRPIDLSICHGAAGVLQSLLFAYEALGDSWYLSLANQYWETVLDLANNNGFYTGEKNRDYLLGYFLGWSGVADSALLLKMYNNGDPAWFPLNLSSVSYQQNNIYKEHSCKEEFEEISK
ncbi:type 2 lanthipeptide synthetase LanM [Halobacillus hunanensis]|uniref:type 2 lanthipeptide synthetase LanM n=1 Tax=Halobacillus hunanensis TaxID=578214 RepID=UPI0009A581BE|nr:type 2 lanthipeptide synthetase LanM [Halobacillus hunanensis]